VKWVVETSGNVYTERNSENNTVKEVQNVQDLIAAQVDAILLMTTNAETGQKACQLANEAEIPLFLVDCSVTDGTGKAQGQVEMNQPDIGRLAGEYVVQKYPGAQYVVLAGLPGQPGGEAQKKGFLDAMAKDSASKLLSEVQYADWDRKKGEDLMRNYLVMHKKIDIVYAMNEEMAYGAYTAIKDAGRENEMKIISANGSAVGKEMIQAGSLEATVGWSPSENGMLCTIKCLDFLAGKPQEFRTEVPLGLYTKDNLDKYSNWDAKDMAAKYEPILKEKGYIK
jgi:ABC-type sugar transport system substrate-binding protein